MSAGGALVAVGAAGFEARLLDAVSSSGMHVVRRCVDIADLVSTAASRQAGVAFVSAQLRGLDREVLVRLADEEVAVVGVTPELPSADEATLRSLGVDVILSADVLHSLYDAVEAAIRGSQQEAPAGERSVVADWQDAVAATRRRGRVLAVWGPTGAPGRSVIALGLTSELAALGAPTTIVDCDVYGGSIAQLLGLLDEASGLLAAARSANSGQLTAELLCHQARAVTPTMRVLTGLPRADRWVEVRPRGIRDILSVTRELSAFAVVDCGFSLELDEEISYDTAAPRRNGATLAALEVADTVIVVGAADPVGLSRLVRALGELRDVVPHCSPVVVVNRMRAGLGWSREDIVATLARAVGSSSVVFMPDDQAAVDAAVVHGRTLGEAAPNSKLTRALRSLAHDLAGVSASARPRTGPSLVRRRQR